MSVTTALLVAVAAALYPVALGRSYMYLSYDQLRDTLYQLQAEA